MSDFRPPADWHLRLSLQKDRDLLNFGRQRPNKIGSSNRQEFADLLEAEFGIAACDNTRDRFTPESFWPYPHVVCNAEALEQFSTHIERRWHYRSMQRLRVQ